MATSVFDKPLDHDLNVHLKMLSTYAETGTTAAYAHAKGDIFIWNNKFYKALKDIAVNATFNETASAMSNVTLYANDVEEYVEHKVNATNAKTVLSYSILANTSSSSITGVVQKTNNIEYMYVAEYYISDPSVFEGDVTLSYSNGKATISYTQKPNSGACDINITLRQSTAAFTTTELNTNYQKLDASKFYGDKMPMSSTDATSVNQAIANVQNGLAYIVGNTNTTGNTLAVGQFLYVKGHSSIAEGLRKVKSSILANDDITTNNTDACSGGGLNELNSNLANYVLTPSVLPVSGFDDFKTKITTIVSSMTGGEIRNIYIQKTGAFDDVFKGGRWWGQIAKYTDSYVTILLHSYVGGILSIYYNNGTWYHNNINDHINIQTGFETITFTPVTGVSVVSSGVYRQGHLIVGTLWLTIPSDKLTASTKLGSFSRALGESGSFANRFTGVSGGSSPKFAFFVTSSTDLLVDNNYNVPSADSYRMYIIGQLATLPT